MTNSMTAFARQQSENHWGILVWEIRSVNHRYLEPSFKLPETLRHLEAKLREMLRKSVHRGKIESQLKLSYQQSAQTDININQALLVQLHHASKQINSCFSNCSEVNPLDILKWPGMIIEPEQNTNEIEAQALDLFSLSLNAMIEHRASEGAQLEEMIEQRLTAISNIITGLKQTMPQILNAHRKKILEQCHKLQIELETSRLEQEIVLIAQKADIEEEIDRLQAHVKEVRKIIKQKGPIGRRLDFLMQELNREANTICSKAIITEISVDAVELKVLIEQMREQIQNIE